MHFANRQRLIAGITIGWMAAPLSASPLDSLAKKLAYGAASLENKKIAVLAFPYHDEKISSGSTLVSERLTTCLVENKKLRVLERNLMSQLLKEKRLSETGVIDPHSLKAIGKIFDAEAIVTGTLIDLPDNRTEINARLIRTDTGEVLSAGQAVIERTWADAPCDIIVRRPAPHVASRLEKNSVVDEDPTPVASLSGKSLRLSNENFPPGRRRYLSNNPSRPVLKKPLSSPYSTTQDSDGNNNSYMYAPYPMSFYRPMPVTVHRGYNGTDGKPLPPPPPLGAHYPLGTIHTDSSSIYYQPTPSDSSK